MYTLKVMLLDVTLEHQWLHFKLNSNKIKLTKTFKIIKMFVMRMLQHNPSIPLLYSCVHY